MVRLVSILFVIGFVTSCEDPFQYSPYDSNVSEYNLNEKNIRKIKPVNSTDTIWFAAFSDIHHWYTELDDAVNKINSLENISFVVACGDITDTGLTKEFRWYNKVMKKLNVPYLTIIGNHDYRSNGKVVYNKMFGPTNFKFELGLYQFIGFDDVVWENKNSFPDIKWLNGNMIDTTKSMKVIFAHIPPWSDELELDTTDLEKAIQKSPDHVLVIHGHEHRYSYRKMNAPHLVMGTLKDKELYLVGLYRDKYMVKPVSF